MSHAYCSITEFYQSTTSVVRPLTQCMSSDASLLKLLTLGWAYTPNIMVHLRIR